MTKSNEGREAEKDKLTYAPKVREDPRCPAYIAFQILLCTIEAHIRLKVV